MKSIVKDKCSGCTACYSICPVSAITMEMDQEGFYYPVINKEKCIHCHKCEQICPFHTQKDQKEKPKAFAARIKNYDTLVASSSGGMFTAISNWFLERKYAIACSFYLANEYKVKYRLIESSFERDKALGSKYMKSDLASIYSESESWLKNNPDKLLLFVGMGCEVDGFRTYSEAKGFRERVILVDIICHGGCSPLIWKEYANYIEDKFKSRIIDISFKDKRIDWYHPTSFAKMESGKEVSICYVNIFNSACAYRPSCYKCPCASVFRNSYITLGDIWGIEKKQPKFYNPKGNSVVLIHTPLGKKIFEEIGKDIDYIECSIEDCLQHNLTAPTPEPSGRKKFWTIYETKGIEKIIRNYGKHSLFYRIKRKIIGILSQIKDVYFMKGKRSCRF